MQKKLPRILTRRKRNINFSCEHGSHERNGSFSLFRGFRVQKKTVLVVITLKRKINGGKFVHVVFFV